MYIEVIVYKRELIKVLKLKNTSIEKSKQIKQQTKNIHINLNVENKYLKKKVK